MQGAVRKPYYRMDKNGYLADLAGAPAEAQLLAHARVLWDVKFSSNDPNMVARNMSGGSGPPVTYPTPTVSDISPRDIAKGTGTFTLTILGTGFVQQSQFMFGAQQQIVSTGNPTSLTSTTVPLQDATGGVDVGVRQPDGQISNTKRFIFRAS